MSTTASVKFEDTSTGEVIRVMLYADGYPDTVLPVLKEFAEDYDGEPLQEAVEYFMASCWLHNWPKDTCYLTEDQSRHGFIDHRYRVRFMAGEVVINSSEELV